MSTEETRKLLELADEWLGRGRRRFASAAKAPTKAEREHIESGGLVYFNCQEELRKLAGEPAPSRIPPKPKGRGSRPV